MLSASLEYRKKISQSSKVAVKATLKYPNGKTEELTGDDIMMGTMSFVQASSSNGSFDIGAAIVGSFDVTLNNIEQKFDEYDFTNAEIVPYIGIDLDDGGIEWVLKGHYLVEQPSSYGNTIKLSCLDYMSKLDTPYTDVATRYPASFRTIVQDVCSHCGLALKNASFANYNISVPTRPDSDALTCRDVVSYVAQASGNFARVDTNGRLELKWYDTAFFAREDWLDGKDFDDHTPYQSGDTADGGNFITYSLGYVADGGVFSTNDYVSISALSSETINTDDVVITGIKVTEQDQEDNPDTEDLDESAEGQTVRFGNEGYVLSIEGNPFVQYGMANTVANAVGSRIVGMRFRPLDVSAIGDPTVEAGDPAIVVDFRQRVYMTYITNCNYKVGSYESYLCGAESAARNSASGFSALTKAIVEQRKKMRDERLERQKAIDELAQQLTESSGIYITPEKQGDGSTIYYMHDKPSKEESLIIWKMTATAIGISTDGGKTYPYGLDVSGMAILNRIYAIGLDADYIKTGALTVDDGRGNVLFSADYDTKQVYVNADTITLQSQKLSNVINGMKASWGTCGTAGSTQTKVVTCPDFVLYTGATINVRFSFANTATNPKLNVNNTGAIAIYAYGSPMTKQYYWAADDLCQFVYSGSYWYLADSGTLAKIKISEGSISLSVKNGKLGSNASIVLDANGTTQTADLDLSAVRTAFANDKSSVTITAGTVTFNSGTFVVNSTYFKVTSTGVITATSGTIGGFTITSSSLYNNRSALTTNTRGVYIGSSGFSCSDGSFQMIMANGYLYGGQGSSENGYVSFNSYLSTTNIYGTRVAGRGCIALLTSNLGVGSYVSYSSGSNITIGQSGTMTYASNLRTTGSSYVQINHTNVGPYRFALCDTYGNINGTIYTSMVYDVGCTYSIPQGLSWNNSSVVFTKGLMTTSGIR